MNLGGLEEEARGVSGVGRGGEGRWPGRDESAVPSRRTTSSVASLTQSDFDNLEKTKKLAKHYDS